MTPVFPTGNQTVLLHEINDDPAVMKKLMHELVKLRCRPYYLYNCDLAEGLSHFRTTTQRGLEILESLWGHTSGYAIPTYVVDAPGGGGKIPLLPDYVVARSQSEIVLRNYEGKTFAYPESAEGETMDDGELCGASHRSAVTGDKRFDE